MEWARDTPWWHKDTYWCMVDCPDGRLCLGATYPLKAAKKRIEEYWRQAEAVEAFRMELRNYHALVFQLEWEDSVPLSSSQDACTGQTVRDCQVTSMT